MQEYDENKIKSGQDFLSSLMNDEVVRNMVVDRVSNESAHIISEYSKILAQAVGSNYENISAVMLMGYLLKTHIDRYEIERSMNG